MQVFLISDRGRQGYLALLDTVTKDGRRNAVKWIGQKYGTGFPVYPGGGTLKTKTARSSAEFDKYIKMCFPQMSVAPVQRGGVVFDLPYVYLGGQPVFQWTPHFEECVSESSLSVLSGGAIIEYIYQRPIYVSMLSMKRHVSAFNRERLLINVNNMYTTRELSVADADVFCEGTYHVENGAWVCDKLTKTPIAGYKSR